MPHESVTPEEEIGALTVQTLDHLNKVTSEGSDRYLGTDIAAGIIGGFINAAEGTAELGTLLVDWFAGTKYSREMNEWVDEMKEYTGLKAHGAAGEMAEAVGEIGGLLVPTIAGAVFGGGVGGAAGASRIGAVGTRLVQKYLKKNMGKTSRIIDLIQREGPKIYASKMGRKIGQFTGTTIGAGIGDAIILHDGRTLVADYFTPDGWEESIGKMRSEEYSPELSPQEDAIRRVKNKLRAGAEGMGGYLALKGIGLGFKGLNAMQHAVGIDAYVGRKGSAVGRGIKEELEKKASLFPEDPSIGSRAARKILSLSRPHGLADEAFTVAWEEKRGKIRSIGPKTDKLMADIEKDLNEFFDGEDGAYSKWIESMPLHERDAVTEDLKRYLTGETPKGAVPASLTKNREVLYRIGDVKKTVGQIQRALASELGRIGEMGGQAAEKAALVMDSIGEYVHRSYRLWDDFKFKAPRGKDRTRLVKEVQRMLVQGIDTDASLKDAENIANSIWNNKETFTTAVKRRYNIDTLEDGARELKENFLKGIEEGSAIDTPKGRAGFTQELSSTEVATGGAGSGILKARGHVDRVLRDIYGEYTNPQSVLINTIRSITTDTANLKFMNEVAEMGLAKDGMHLVRPGQDAAMKFYRRVPDTPLRFGNLAGKMIHEDIADEIIQSYKIHPSLGDKIWGMLYTMKGGFQAVKTILTPVTGLGNVISNIVPTSARMNFFRGGNNIRESMGLVGRQIKGTMNNNDLKTLATAMDLNLMDSAVDLNQSLTLLEEGLQKGNFSVIDNLGRALRGDPSDGGFIKRSMSWFMNKAQDVYRGEDDLFKLYNYFAEKAKYSNVMPWMNAIALDPGRSGLSVLDMIAAGNTRMMLPSFDRMPSIMKHLRKWPFAGNFSSFAAESIRTGFNGIQMGLNEMAGRFKYAERWIDLDVFRPGNDEALNKLATEMGWMKKGTNVPVNFQQQVFRKANGQFMSAREINSAIDYSKKELARIGTRSVIGNLAAQSSMGYTAAAAGSMLTGIAKDEIDSWRRDLASAWDATGTIVPLGRRHDGGPGFEYVNFNLLNYFNTTQSTVKAFLNEFDRSANDGRGNVVSAIRAATHSMLTLADPFIGLSVPIEKMVDIGARSGRTRDGAIVFREQDDWGDMLAKSLAHVINQYNPTPLSVTWQPNIMEQASMEESIMDTFYRYAEGVTEAGPLVQGIQSLRGVEGWERDKYGKKVDALKQFMPYMIRLRPQVADPIQSLRFKGHELTGLSRSIANEFKSTVDRMPGASRENVLSAFMHGQRQLFKAHKKYSRMIDTAKKMGMSDNDIRRLMVDSKMGHREEIIDGKFPPLQISEEVAAELENRGMGELIHVANSLARVLANVDVVESTEIIDQIMREEIFGDIPKPAPPPAIPNAETISNIPPGTINVPPGTINVPPGTINVPTRTSNVPEISEAQYAAAALQGAGAPVASQRKERPLVGAATLLPNPRDLSLAQDLGLVEQSEV
jgi:hypothetical protein